MFLTEENLKQLWAMGVLNTLTYVYFAIAIETNTKGNDFELDIMTFIDDWTYFPDENSKIQRMKTLTHSQVKQAVAKLESLGTIQSVQQLSINFLNLSEA